ncbi:MAG: chromosomal replication initiation protein [Microgenomates bacterium 39_7]|nr:MAG: chromosomal replication initiation protein [Microgenomates bacterium 39_7]
MSTQTLSQEEVKLIWSQVKEELKLKISPAAFNTWVLLNPLTTIEVIDQTKARGTISSPSAFHATNLKKNLYSHLKTSIENVIKKKVELDIRVSDPASVLASQKQMFGSSNKDNWGWGGSKSGVTTANNESHSRQPTYSNGFYGNGSNKVGSPTVEELFSQSNIQSSSFDRTLSAVRQAGLKMDYQFESFAVSGSNEMAHAAATAVAKRPGEAYNPLFFYGGVGVGKTHLMQAIGHYILKQDPGLKVIYCTGEEFTNDIIDAIRNKKATTFKKKFRSAHTLLIDDIQFIGGKNAVQEEFFHTFNALTKLSSQIVLTSDRPPSEINLLEDRLKSRFEAGLMVDIQQPSAELKTAIVLIKAKSSGLSMPIKLAEQIASRVDGARKIEGVIATIRSEVELKKKEMDEELITSILEKEKNDSKDKRIKLRPQKVIKKVSSYYQINQTALKGKRRNKEIVEARHMAMFILKNDLEMSYVDIGKWFSNRDHTSVMHAKDKIEQLIKEDVSVQEDYHKIKGELVNISR